MSDIKNEVESFASALWKVQHTKSCPNCKGNQTH
jgi:hypothetical protein